MYVCNPPYGIYLFVCFPQIKSHTGVLCMYAADMFAIACVGANEGRV